MLLVLTFTGVLGCFLWMTQMPLKSYAGALHPLTPEESDLRDRLSADVTYLSVKIGDRSPDNPPSLQAAKDYLVRFLRDQNYAVVEQPYSVEGRTVFNIEATLPGADDKLGQVIIGAHYDSVVDTVAADDNGTGVAAVLELARLMRQSKPLRTIRFVLFVNEEPPYFQTDNMGSRVYAHKLRQEGVPVSAMLSLETIGFYSDQKGSQKYPGVLGLFYPSQGNFIAFAAKTDSRALVREYVRNFRHNTRFPSEGIAAPSDWPGIGWSDQWSFWQEGYPGVMVTDTAPFRNPYYHTASDTVEKLDFDRMARVVEGIHDLTEQLANKP